MIAQLDFDKANGKQACQKDDRCLEAGTVIYQPDYLQFEAERCVACGRPRLLVLPEHLNYYAQNAHEMDLLRECGYAQAIELTPKDWAGLRAVEIARRKANSDSVTDREEQGKRQQEEAQFSAWHQKATGSR